MLYRWPDGSQHTISYQQHTRNMEQARIQRIAQQGAANGSPSLQANLAAQPGQSVVGGAPPAAAAAAPHTFQPDSGYNDAVDFAGRQRIQTYGDIAEEEKKAKYDFGFDDQTNPFSRVQEAKKLYLANSLRSGTSFAAMGQSTGGAYQRAIERNRHNEEKGNADLRRVYENALAALNRQRTGADTSFESAKLEAWRQAMARQGA